MTISKPTICAVSYLNTTPLVWGMLHGSQQGAANLMFRLPSECAALLEAGDADIGLVPAIELARQQLTMVHGVGIACRGEVRSILLVHKGPLAEVRTLAADTSSRTSVALAQVVLARRFGVEVRLIPQPPNIGTMLASADAALVIGDPALQLNTPSLRHPTLDLGHEWHAMTGLPMVFAVWAGRRDAVGLETGQMLRESCRFGIDHMEDVIRSEAPKRGFPVEVVRDYLTRRIVHEFGTAEYEGLNLFLELAAKYSSPRPVGESIRPAIPTS